MSKEYLVNVKKYAKVLVVACLCLLIFSYSSNSVSGAGETITAASTAVTEIKTPTSISGIQVNGTDNSTVSVKLLASSGSLAMDTTTGLTFKNASGTTISNPQTGSTLYFSGARSDINAALATLKYTRNVTGSDTLEISLVAPGEVFFSGTGHLYEYVSSTLDWYAANIAAGGRTKYGANGYLATITSQEENNFVSARLVSAGWMGASDATSEGSWRWVTGPESGTTFCVGNNPCNSQSGRYTNWNNSEPNDSGGNEDCGQFLAGGSGKWNDLPCSGTTLPGYVVEYGAPGNMPSVAATNIAITTTDSVAPTTPGVPAATSPTTDTTPALSWVASTDSGTGLATQAYTLEWSTSEEFSSILGSRTTSSTSLSPSSALTDGTWYFRVKASDVAGNVAVSGVSSPVIIDTTAPTTPGIPTTGSLWTNDTTPTWSWAQSVDSGVGLATIAYSIQWSQDTDFFGLGGSAGIPEATEYTIPDGLDMAEGTWYFRLKSTDSLGNESPWSSYGTVHVDTTPPVITANGSSAETIVQGTAYNDAGAIVADVAEGDVSANLSTTNLVDSNTPGTYTVTYNASDSAGNAAAPAYRTVQVVSNTDLNGDGTADALQSNTSGYQSTITGKTVLIDVGTQCEITTDDLMRESNIEVDDPDFSYENGLFDFAGDCGASGFTTTIKLYYYGVSKEGLVARKFNPNTQRYSSIPNASIEQTTINGAPVTILSYDITDGGELDTDGQVDGKFTDPAGLALANKVDSAVALGATGQSQYEYMYIALITAVGILVFSKIAVWRYWLKQSQK